MSNFTNYIENNNISNNISYNISYNISNNIENNNIENNDLNNNQKYIRIIANEIKKIYVIHNRSLILAKDDIKNLLFQIKISFPNLFEYNREVFYVSQFIKECIIENEQEMNEVLILLSK